MATTTGRLMSVEEYLKYTGKPNAEYIDGELRPKPMPTSLHGLIQMLLGMLLRQQGADCRSEVTVRLSPTRFLVPDLVADSVIEDPYPTKPVQLCVEILSPEDRLGAMLAKCESYHAWGVPYCWVIDPVKQTAWEYHANFDPNRIEASGTLHAGNWQAHLAELFAPQNR
jgi:Uma2 family endonuclease